ncbi:hypothetical protein PA598K_07138 [Paenibacillus sp. 598K]|uniref:hypothetical protein n=1 Tax=Paenibacillus sp. 598K TaxID=1117987 RepID=UPI000FF9C42A|nr:hypothetical protein [Paenibacillus sp. 598K]GBF78487.1 hypothetical protein PA598K_07138 [Paenibacillus sp. 598K]
MKYRMHILFVVLLSLILLMSCSHPENKINLEEYKNEYSYGLQVFDTSMEMLPNAIDEFSPNKERIIKFFNLTDHNTDYTLLVTLNGSLCSIKVDGQQAGLTYNSNAEANSEIEMDVSIQLKEEQLLPEFNYLVFTVITENQVANVQNTDLIFNKVSFAHQLNIPNTVQVAPLKMTIDKNDYHLKSDEIIDRYKKYQFATLQDIETKRYEMIINRSLQVDSDKRLGVRVEAVGDNGLYSLLLFYNNKPFLFSGNKHNYTFELDGDNMLSKELEITAEDKEGSLFALVFPLDNENYNPFLTNKATFEAEF